MCDSRSLTGTFLLRESCRPLQRQCSKMIRMPNTTVGTCSNFTNYLPSPFLVSHLCEVD